MSINIELRYIMISECQKLDYKSVQKIRTGDKGFRDLSVTCVAFANAQGGKIIIGVEDKTLSVPSGQRISQAEANETASRLRSLCFNVGLTVDEVQSNETGDQYFTINVFPSLKSWATTSDGKMYIRLADKCEPIRSEDLMRVGEEKGAYQWELLKTPFILDRDSMSRLSVFANDIRKSDRVKEHIKQMDDIEVAQHYHLVDDGYLTNLGVVWIGNANQRKRISYPITVEYIVYDSLERKVRKEEWRNHQFNPKELLEDILERATELKYFFEVPNGLFRNSIRYYNESLLRELLVNAIAHKSNTISNDITIKVYDNHIEISNPGGLPLGITPENILHTKHRRNPNMIEILSALKLMEGEGSGYDLIYELNASEAKPQPKIESTFNTVTVYQSAEIIDAEIIPLIDFVDQNYALTQKNRIAFGIIARERRISSTQLAKELQLAIDDRLRGYTDNLLKDGLIQKSGVKKGTSFYVNPQLLKNAKANIATSLKTIEPHVLKALIKEDITRYPGSKISEIAERIRDVDIKDIRKYVYSMVGIDITTHGARTNRRYFPM